MAVSDLRWSTWDLGSLIRDRTHIPCVGRQILNHWTTREVPATVFNNIIPLRSSLIAQLENNLPAM